MPTEDYSTRPILSDSEWYAEHRHPEFFSSDEEAPGEGVKKITKEGTIVRIWNQRGQQVCVGQRSNQKALAAIALRGVKRSDGTPLISHAMVDRLKSAGASEEDVAVLRSLLPPAEYEDAVST